MEIIPHFFYKLNEKPNLTTLHNLKLVKNIHIHIFIIKNIHFNDKQQFSTF